MSITHRYPATETTEYLISMKFLAVAAKVCGALKYLQITSKLRTGGDQISSILNSADYNLCFLWCLGNTSPSPVSLLMYLTIFKLYL